MISLQTWLGYGRAAASLDWEWGCSLLLLSYQLSLVRNNNEFLNSWLTVRPDFKPSDRCSLDVPSVRPGGYLYNMLVILPSSLAWLLCLLLWHVLTYISETLTTRSLTPERERMTAVWFGIRQWKGSFHLDHLGGPMQGLVPTGRGRACKGGALLRLTVN